MTTLFNGVIVYCLSPPGVELLQLFLAVPSIVYSEVGKRLCVPGLLCHRWWLWSEECSLVLVCNISCLNSDHLHLQQYSDLSTFVSLARNVERSTLLLPRPTGMLTETRSPSGSLFYTQVVFFPIFPVMSLKSLVMRVAVVLWMPDRYYIARIAIAEEDRADQFAGCLW